MIFLRTLWLKKAIILKPWILSISCSPYLIFLYNLIHAFWSLIWRSFSNLSFSLASLALLRRALCSISYFTLINLSYSIFFWFSRSNFSFLSNSASSSSMAFSRVSKFCKRSSKSSKLTFGPWIFALWSSLEWGPPQNLH